MIDKNKKNHVDIHSASARRAFFAQAMNTHDIFFIFSPVHHPIATSGSLFSKTYFRPKKHIKETDKRKKPNRVGHIGYPGKTPGTRNKFST